MVELSVMLWLLYFLSKFLLVIYAVSCSNNLHEHIFTTWTWVIYLGFCLSCAFCTYSHHYYLHVFSWFLRLSFVLRVYAKSIIFCLHHARAWCKMEISCEDLCWKKRNQRPKSKFDQVKCLLVKVKSLLSVFLKFVALGVLNIN